MLMKSKRKTKGFSLIEALFASVLVSLGIVAVVGASLSHTRTNTEAQSINKAVMLAQQAREYVMGQSFNLVTSQTFTTCIDAMGDTIADTDGWTQQISVEYRNASDITAVSTTPTNIKSVTLDVSYNGNTMFSDSWIITYRWEE